MAHSKREMHIVKPFWIVVRLASQSWILTDHKYLLALIKGHNEVLVEHGVPTKIPAPICHFEKRWNRSIGWSTLGFWLKCINGFETDFSYKKAIRRKVDSPDLNFYKACREAIALDALEAKKEAFKRHCNSDGEVQCEITARWLKFEDAHLDHAGPFFLSDHCFNVSRKHGLVR